MGDKCIKKNYIYRPTPLAMGVIYACGKLGHTKLKGKNQPVYVYVYVYIYSMANDIM